MIYVPLQFLKFWIPLQLGYVLLVLAVSESLWSSFVRKHRKKYGLHIDVYDAAFTDYREIVQRRIDRERSSANMPVLEGIDVACAMESLRKLHSKYIVAPADKAANNFVICCKKYYLQCMCEEMGVGISQNGVMATGNETYEVCNVTEEHVYKPSALAVILWNQIAK